MGTARRAPTIRRDRIYVYMKLKFRSYAFFNFIG